MNDQKLKSLKKTLNFSMLLNLDRAQFVNFMTCNDFTRKSILFYHGKTQTDRFNREVSAKPAKAGIHEI